MLCKGVGKGQGHTLEMAFMPTRMVHRLPLESVGRDNEVRAGAAWTSASHRMLNRIQFTSRLLINVAYAICGLHSCTRDRMTGWVLTGC